MLGTIQKLRNADGVIHKLRNAVGVDGRLAKVLLLQNLV